MILDDMRRIKDPLSLVLKGERRRVSPTRTPSASAAEPSLTAISSSPLLPIRASGLPGATSQYVRGQRAEVEPFRRTASGPALDRRPSQVGRGVAEGVDVDDADRVGRRLVRPADVQQDGVVDRPGDRSADRPARRACPTAGAMTSRPWNVWLDVPGRQVSSIRLPPAWRRQAQVIRPLSGQTMVWPLTRATRAAGGRCRRRGRRRRGEPCPAGSRRPPARG